MSGDLIWEIVKNNSCFLIKRDRLQMTTEPNNLTNFNTFKYSGIANAKTVGIVPKEGGAGCVLTVKARKGAKTRKPVKMYNKMTLSKDFRRVAKTITNETAGNFYRPDLAPAALAKWSAISKSQKTPKAAPAKTRRGRK